MTNVVVPRAQMTELGKRVVAALIARDRKLLFLEKPDHPGFLMLPGGGLLEEDEGLVSALRRQLGEELGFSPQTLPAHPCGRVVDRGVGEQVTIHLHRLEVPLCAVFQTGFGFTLNWLDVDGINQNQDKFTPVTLKCVEYAVAIGLI